MQTILLEFFKGCLSQVLLGLILNTFSQMLCNSIACKRFQVPHLLLEFVTLQELKATPCKAPIINKEKTACTFFFQTSDFCFLYSRSELRCMNAD